MPSLYDEGPDLWVAAGANTGHLQREVVAVGRPPDPLRREFVLDRAVAYLAEHGLSNLTMRRLATALGTSTQTISYQFGSKENLIEAALGRAKETTLGILDTVRREEPSSTVSQGILHLWSWWMSDPKHLVSTRLNMEAMMAPDDALAADRRPRLLSFWIDYFAQWFRQDHGCDYEEATIRSTLLMAVLSGLIIDLDTTGDEQRVHTAMLSYLNLLDSQRNPSIA
jgi:AcrR family transcriptional regulator